MICFSYVIVPAAKVATEQQFSQTKRKSYATILLLLTETCAPLLWVAGNAKILLYVIL